MPKRISEETFLHNLEDFYNEFVKKSLKKKLKKKNPEGILKSGFLKEFVKDFQLISEHVPARFFLRRIIEEISKAVSVKN